MPDRIVITTGARLHFGFFAHRPVASAPEAVAAADAAGTDANAGTQLAPVLERANYGGVGLMVASPGFVLAAAPSDCDRISLAEEPRDDGLLALAAADRKRQLELAGRQAARLVEQYRLACPSQREPPGCAIEVRRAIPPHRGLGSGTQLALAVGQALELLSGDQRSGDQGPRNEGASVSDRGTDCLFLARRMARGKRSAIGVHGFACGGFLIDGAKTPDAELGRLLARADVPGDWRFLLVAPADASQTGLSGQEEIDALARLPPMRRSVTERLCRLALLEMLPALAEADVERFGEALFEFGRAVGDYFQPVQGGVYADPRMAELAAWLRRQKVRGVAQTSWGPTLAVCCGDPDTADTLQERILADERGRGCWTHIASPLNTRASVQTVIRPD